jgi:hypothetical protein
MPTQPDPEAVDTDDDYVHVRYRDPGAFETIRTPDLAAHRTGRVLEDCEVRVGRREDDDEWVVQSVLVEREVDESEAFDLAERAVQHVSV